MSGSWGASGAAPRIHDCVVSRATVQARTTYVIRTLAGRHVDSLSFREVMALVASEGGRVVSRWRRCQSPWFVDRYLNVECDDYGVGPGTLDGLSGRYGHQAYLETPKSEGTVYLTPWGRDVLAEIRALSPTLGGPEHPRAAHA